jgi:hypothetical protein
VETIVLLGNSGGGSLMAAYQAQSTVTLGRHAAGRGPRRPATADGYVASAAHPGRPEVLTAWMDAAVIDENDAVASDPDLDLFNDRNGPASTPTSSRATAPPRSPATTPSPTGRGRTGPSRPRASPTGRSP